MRRIALIASAVVGLALLASAPARADWSFQGIVWNETDAVIEGNGTYHNPNNMTVGAMSSVSEGGKDEPDEDMDSIEIAGYAKYQWQGANPPTSSNPVSGFIDYATHVFGGAFGSATAHGAIDSSVNPSSLEGGAIMHGSYNTLGSATFSYISYGTILQAPGFLTARTDVLIEDGIGSATGAADAYAGVTLR